MKEATFSKKFKTLHIFVSRNTAEYVNCPDVKTAKIKIKNSGVEQTLKIA